MSTDRPDFTESPIALVPGSVQLEFGGTWADFVGFSILSGPELLVRIGALNRVELRVTAPNYLDVENTSGFTDITLGAKVQLSDENSVLDLAVIAQASIPTGDEEFTSDRIEPEIIGIVGTEISPGISVAAQAGIKSIKAIGENEILFMVTFVLSGEVATRLSAFGEVRYDHRPGFSTYVIHTGLVYAISNDLQIDFHGGDGLSNISGDLFLGAGVAVRL